MTALQCISSSPMSQELPKHGLALSSLGSISLQTLAGAISTGTHGTGIGFGCIGSAVLALRVITPEGKVTMSRRGSSRHVIIADHRRLGLAEQGCVRRGAVLARLAWCRLTPEVSGPNDILLPKHKKQHPM